MTKLVLSTFRPDDCYSQEQDGKSSQHSLGKSSKNKMNPKPESRPFYEAESPDELALVDAAFAYNFKLLKRLVQRLK